MRMSRDNINSILYLSIVSITFLLLVSFVSAADLCGSATVASHVPGSLGLKLGYYGSYANTGDRKSVV
jgi:hypothetical protein